MENAGHAAARGARTRAVGGHGREAHAPESLIFTLQGDGDMVNEGLQEVIHTAHRGSVHDARGVVKTKNMLRKAFEAQREGRGFSFVEILTMCPTGWFVPTADPADGREAGGE